MEFRKLRGAPGCCRGAASLVDQSWISRTAETACVFQSQLTRSSVVGDCAAAPATPSFPLVPDPLPQPRLPMSSACRLGPVQSNLGFFHPPTCAIPVKDTSALQVGRV